eukprot:12039245-Alexandrium_andersonii.AAC.1
MARVGPSPGGVTGDPVAPCPRLARWGHRCLTAALNSWWALWRRRRTPDLSEGAELREIARGSPCPPSPALDQWL